MNKQNQSAVKRGVGRPKYVPQFPRKEKWTFQDYCVTNGVNPNTGKGDRCSALTLRKTFGYDATLGENSVFVKLDGMFGKPDSEDGLGKPPSLFAKRSVAVEKGWPIVAAAKPLVAKKAVKTKTKKAVKAKKPAVEIPLAPAPVIPVAPVVNDAVSSETKAYESLKNELLAPVPVVAISTPAPAPVAEVAPAPVAEAVTAS